MLEFEKVMERFDPDLHSGAQIAIIGGETLFFKCLISLETVWETILVISNTWIYSLGFPLSSNSILNTFS